MFGYVDDDAHWDEFGPLLYCLAFAIENVVGRPVDYYLRGIFTGQGPCGGDPGWLLYEDRLEDGRSIFHASTVPDISGLEPSEADYEEHVVKQLVRQVLESFRHFHPERSAEVDEAITRYQL